MTINLFSSPSQENIRVGYIDPERGYVSDISICEANSYAKKNPGTTFLFKTGNKVLKYLNINEINQLTPDDLLDDKECEGINQKKQCGPPTIQIYGGGGIGALGNPIIGTDGSILAVDLVSGGHGYQYTPQVAANDICQYGSGSVLTAVLGEVVETVETYTTEDDFEEYETCETINDNLGRRFGPSGEDLGFWDPQTYTKLEEDPIRREIEKYTEIIRQVSRKPFWSTRKNKPDKITSSDISRVNPTQKYDVSFPEWNDFMNNYAVSPVSPSNVKGTDYASTIFTFEWDNNFPVTGEYVFNGLCDNNAVLYLDDVKLSDLRGFKSPVNPIKKTLTEGIHKIKIDLINTPIVETVTTKQDNFIDVSFNVYGQGGNTEKINFSFTSEDGTHSFVVQGVSVSKENRTEVIKVKPNTNYKVVASTRKKNTVVEQGVIKNNKKNKEGGFEKSNKIFADHLESANDNDDMQITVESGIFTPSNKRKTPLGRTTFDLTFRVESNLDLTSILTQKIVSSLSWNENPLGVALTIDAPEPPVPQEPIIEQEGRCPRNPIWTTRFPGSSQIWFPVKYTDAWSRFMNRYAISPVRPLDLPGSDASGATFVNNWDIDIPYDGFYGVKGTRDNFGRLLIDSREVSKLNGFSNQSPITTKVFLTKGRHKITVEVSNKPEATNQIIDKLIFRTKDWQTNNVIGDFIDVSFDIYGQGGNTNKMSFSFSSEDGTHSFVIQGAKSSKKTRTDVVQVKPNTNYKVVATSTRGKVEQGVIKNNTKNKEGGLNTSNKIFADHIGSENDNDDIQVTAKLGTFTPSNKRNNPRTTFDLSFRVDISANSSVGSITKNGSVKNGVTYVGPDIFAYKDNRWSNFMNNQSVSPYLPPFESENPAIIVKRKYLWKNVDFPESGEYRIAFQADNIGTLYIGDRKVLITNNFDGEGVFENINVSKGKYDIYVELENTPNRKNIFNENPVGFALVVRKNITLASLSQTPWSQNPIGISAILIPPPCPRKIKGRGVVTDVIVNDPGNGYLPPVSTPSTQVYPVTLRLKDVIVENPGINYSCGEDQLTITPNNGAILDYVCDPFGRIKEVNVIDPGLGFTEYPDINLPSLTGVNASFRPVFEVVRDPIVIDERKLIQVTDLVGLKQTGYVDGRNYYGAVFYKEGIRYAGFYETPGDLVQVYDTLQESITAQVTTPPSAIQRQGTDVSSNNPRLNIPGTPENLI